MDREKLFYEMNTDTYYFRTFRTIRSFGDNIYNGKITSEEANESQAELAEEIVKFMNKTKPKKKENKKDKEIVKTYIIFIMVERWFLMLLRVKYFRENQKAQVF